MKVIKDSNDILKTPTHSPRPSQSRLAESSRQQKTKTEHNINSRWFTPDGEAIVLGGSVFIVCTQRCNDTSYTLKNSRGFIFTFSSFHFQLAHQGSNDSPTPSAAPAPSRLTSPCRDQRSAEDRGQGLTQIPTGLTVERSARCFYQRIRRGAFFCFMLMTQRGSPVPRSS